MNDEELLKIMSEWNFWGKGRPDVGIEREFYSERIIKLLNSVKVIAISGIRRAGKSFIARQVLKRLIDSGISPEDTLIIRLDDERLVNLNYELLLKIYNLYLTYVKKDKSRPTYLVLDEAQEVEGWERFVRGLEERCEAKIIVTGSSAKLLSSEFTTLLSGRHVEVRVTPLSFREVLEFKGIKVKSGLELAENMDRIKRELVEMMEYGGFPDVVLNPGVRAELIHSYFDTIIIKDVVNRYKIRREEKIRVLAKFYISSSASKITYNSVSKFLKIPVKTVERYSEYLEKSFLIFFLKNYSISPKAVENSPRKVYVIDNGFLKYFSTASLGRIFETLIVQHLYRYALRRFYEIYYWSSEGSEVDVVIKSGKKILPIQITYELNYENEERELKGLKKFKKYANYHDAFIITFEQEREVEGVKVVPAYKFLLNLEELLDPLME
ncbi:MAG: ATP-binding protein [Sulfolobaceae archaeon]